MEPMSLASLASLSREELIGIILHQQELIGRLEARVEELEAQPSRPQLPKGMPGNKLEPKREPKPKKERKQREHHYVRRRHPQPDERVEHAYAQCPRCGTGLCGGSVKFTREVIEVRPSPVVVTEHVYLERCCPYCEERFTPPVELDGVETVGKSRLGIQLTALIAVLREEARLPIATILWYLKTLHELVLSPGAIVQVLQRVAQRGQAEVAQILERIRGAPYVHADESGWREDGENGYVWTYSTPSERYFTRGGRDKGVVQQVLGAEFGGVLVTDFYAAYNTYPGQHQRCWTHLLRDIHQLREQYPQDESVQQWAAAVRQVYERGKQWVKEHPELHAEQHWQTTYQAARILEGQLLDVCKPYLTEVEGEAVVAPQRTLCERIGRYIKELFTFVAVPGVPSENNAAERSLRHLVVTRKISGGTRSQAGTDTKMTLATLFGTWRVRGLNPYHACLGLLQSQQL